MDKLKKTPQEIADFFGCWVAINENHSLFISKEKPKIKTIYLGSHSFQAWDSERNYYQQYEKESMPFIFEIAYKGNWNDSLHSPTKKDS